MKQNVMDAAVLELLERQIKESPEDEGLKRLYAVVHGAIRFNGLTREKQEAIEEELEKNEF
jgi:hypothetical protein